MSGQTWTVFPAIDLHGGRVVRLLRGDPQSETVYADDPVAVALRWKEAGATWVHVVNLDGAFGLQSSSNLQALEGILKTGLRVQFGGGVRERKSILRLSEAGVSRIALGTVALERPEILSWALETLGPEQIAVAIDTENGWVRVRGWQQATRCTAHELARRCAAKGVQWILYTDIARDGTGQGLDPAPAVALARDYRFRVIIAGGVARLEDIVRAREAGLAGVIVGRALYDGHIDLREALAV
jgi:phosphoribosylformimino-5-aminoimidazole carboxamide ribotide isomerase